MRALVNLFLIVLVMIVSCQKKEVYSYEKEFTTYLQNILEYDEPLNNQIFYLIPINSCSACVSKNIDLLIDINSKDIVPVIIGRVENTDYMDKIRVIESKFELLFDSSNEVRYYEIGLGKPLVIVFKEGRPIFSKQIADYEVENLRQYLETLREG